MLIPSENDCLRKKRYSRSWRCLSIWLLPIGETMSLAVRMRFEPLKKLGFASIGAGYMGIGSGLSHPAREILVQNLTDKTLVFSEDGIIDKFKLPAMSGYVLDITANKTNQVGLFVMAEGERLYVKQDSLAPTSGEVCFSAVYGAQD
jgi:hypothetical protein